ncbi:hypothetical protein VTI28DRAFT_4426 [Corynascus sepedonium]
MGRKKKSRRIVEEFNTYFGAGTLQDWQRLCRDVGINGDLPSITQCRKALKTVHINIHDLVDAVMQGRQPQRFPNVRQLVEYTISTRKFYPKNKIKEMGPVKALMRHIL